MAHKTNPNLFRLGITQNHHADWCVDMRQYPLFLSQDMNARTYLMKKFNSGAVISKIFISRSQDVVEIKIKCLKPSVIVGKKGGEINIASAELEKIYGCSVKIKIHDIKRPELDAFCVATEVANEIRKRGVSCKRIIKRAVQNAIKNGAVGIRIDCAGRLGGVEIAKTEWYQEKALPRHKLRANISYAYVPSFAAWGTCGVKVWIYLGDFIKKNDKIIDKGVSIDSDRSVVNKNSDKKEAKV